MLHFYAQDFLDIAHTLGIMESMATANRLSPAFDAPLQAETRTTYIETLRSFDFMCRHIHLDSACDQIARMLDRCSNDDSLVTEREFCQMHTELHNRIMDDFSHHLLFAIPRHEVKYYEQRGSLFGDSVSNAFPSALDDIEEAGKCYATERTTACVFHLMHVMERGLRALAGELNDPRLDPKTNPSWESILRKCDDELKKPYKDRSPHWSAKNQFFSQATATLRAVKDAWRNPTIHIENKYNDDEALDVLNAVGAFMRHISSELRERPMK
jgi:hypothetical protein